MSLNGLVTVAETFAAAVTRYPDHEFLYLPAEATASYAPGAVSLTYRAAAQLLERLQAAYRAVGYGARHRVALALDNRADFFLHFIALNALEVSIVPVNAAMSQAERAHILAHSDVALVVAHSGHEQLMRSALPAACGLSSDPLLSSVPPPPRKSRVAAAGEVALLYTSGTSGVPKGCILDQRYFYDLGEHYVNIGGYCAFNAESDRLITPLPVTHMNALACSFLAMVRTGGCLVQLDRFHPSTWWHSVRGSRATCFHYLGVMPALLLAAAPSELERAGRQLRFGFGAGLDPRHHAAFEARFGVPLVEAWAMTETGGAAWITASHEPRHVGARCFGRAPAGLEFRIVDESTRDVPSGEPGELLVRRAGAHPRRGFFAGYYKDAAATEAVWEGGWFHTGDLVRVGSDGSFYFVDRLKNMIRRSGENIAAIEVESVLMQSLAVTACAVTAVPDEIRGEEVFAFVVARGGIAGDFALATALQAECLGRLAYFKVPAYVAFLARIPQTASQKLARGELKRMAAAAVAGGDAIDLRATKKRPAAACGAAAARES